MNLQIIIILKSSALLRHLIIDGNPLVHQVNKKYKEKLIFETIPEVDEGLFNIQGLHGFINPSPEVFGDKVNRSQLNLQNFLNYQCIIHNGKSYSVREVVKYCANIAGGVHLGEPKTDKEKLLNIWDQSLRFLDMEHTLLTLREISKVVLHALTPLVNRVKNE